MLTSDKRRGELKRLLDGKRCLRALEAHSPISALLAQHPCFKLAPDQSVGYDATWSSSLTDSTHNGLPDIEILSASDRLQKVREIYDVCALRDGERRGSPAKRRKRYSERMAVFCSAWASSWTGCAPKASWTIVSSSSHRTTVGCRTTRVIEAVHQNNGPVGLQANWNMVGGVQHIASAQPPSTLAKIAPDRKDER